MNTAVLSKSDRIRTLNDCARRTFTGCAVMITLTVQELGDEEKAQLLSAVREFNRFDADNNPHHEHDFGAIDLHGQKWFWKFDYYAPDMRAWGLTIQRTSTKPTGYSPSCMPASIEYAHHCHRRQAVRLEGNPPAAAQSNPSGVKAATDPV